jgi:predicted lactoylglutathione lyase
MATKIFVNLPVKNLSKSIEFFTRLGYTFNPQFTDETATCMIVSEDIYIMLLTEEKFKMFTKKEIADATHSTEAIICLSADSREKVDEMINKALEAGGTTPKSLKAIDADIKQIEAKIMALMRKDESLNHLFKLVTSVVGIGFVTATNLIIHTNQFTVMNDSRKLACFCGVAPFPHQSGPEYKR